jgi:hypothetical protein
MVRSADKPPTVTHDMSYVGTCAGAMATPASTPISWFQAPAEATRVAAYSYHPHLPGNDDIDVPRSPPDPDLHDLQDGGSPVRHALAESEVGRCSVVRMAGKDGKDAGGALFQEFNSGDRAFSATKSSMVPRRRQKLSRRLCSAADVSNSNKVRLRQPPLVLIRGLTRLRHRRLPISRVIHCIGLHTTMSLVIK